MQLNYLHRLAINEKPLDNVSNATETTANNPQQTTTT